MAGLAVRHEPARTGPAPARRGYPLHLTLARVLFLLLFIALSAAGCASNTGEPAISTPTQPAARQAAGTPSQFPPPATLTPQAMGAAQGPGGGLTPRPTQTGASGAEASVHLAPVWTVGEGSEATFTVGEKLALFSLPNDAVVKTGALSGTLRRDGPSVVVIDLLKLSSDQGQRDRYMRGAMFRNTPRALFTFDHVPAMPERFVEARVAEGTVTGSLSMGGKQVPLTFTGEARYEAGAIHLLAKTTFTWAEAGIRAPNLAGIVEVQDMVRVEVRIVAVPTV